MQKTRNNVFETNSSSIHTITVVNKSVELPITAKEIYVGLGEFGWELECYKEPHDILSYIYTAICYNYGKEYKTYTKFIEKVLSERTNVRLSWEEPIFDKYSNKYYLENGYIDHGYELKKWLEDLFDDDDLLLATIFGGIIETGNDNDDSGGSSIIPADVREYYSYYKGN